MTCQDCIHFDVCGYHITEMTQMTVNECPNFKPQADVVEVKHGTWHKVCELAPRYVCTCCHHLYNNRGYKYCPNCGAKMDGEKTLTKKRKMQIEESDETLKELKG